MQIETLELMVSEFGVYRMQILISSDGDFSCLVVFALPFLLFGLSCTLDQCAELLVLQQFLEFLAVQLKHNAF